VLLLLSAADSQFHLVDNTAAAAAAAAASCRFKSCYWYRWALSAH